MLGSTRNDLTFALAVGVVMAGLGVNTYNRLVRLGQGVKVQWSQVENVYQRRADLVPNLVETVKGAAKFEKDTLTAVTEARARVGQVQLGAEPADPAALAEYQQAQDQLSSALSRLLAVAESYPELKATASFRDLQVQLEGAENRIAVERRRYGEVVQAYNAARDTFPTSLIATRLGPRFDEKAYFKAQSGTVSAPTVHF